MKIDPTFDSRNQRPRLVRGMLLLVLCIALPALAADKHSSAAERIAHTDWGNIRGVNFIPSYAANTYDIWHNYDHDAFDRQLALASDVGYNSVRLWLNYEAYREQGAQMIHNVRDAVQLAATHDLRVVIVLFDSCGIRPRQNIRWMTAEKAYEQFQSEARFSSEQKAFMKLLFDNYVHGFGANTMVPVAPDTPMMALIYQSWVPTPGSDRLGSDWYAHLEQYVDAVIDSLRNDANVLLWDLMNEPEWASEGPISPTEIITPGMKLTRDAFLDHFHRYIKSRYPDELVGVGWAMFDNAKNYAQLSDVVTFHTYGDANKLQKDIDAAREFEQQSGKRVLITETLANWDFGRPDFGKLSSDEEQLAHYKSVLPMLVKSPVGWMGWGLVISHDFDPWTDIFYPNGTPRPAAQFLKTMLQTSASKARIH